MNLQQKGLYSLNMNPAGIPVGDWLLEVPLGELFPITECLPEKYQEPET